eukprot:TRINITY_DN11117_c0_g1_i1.p1 TRINITY_DN11117_c0_g1~~TRINITY_DN11117_c0_g1_i1.p1  ORF type:complete len:292 (-),score=55.26 TRINITY_DN11117_c0_g1_i1:29-904(-)
MSLLRAATFSTSCGVRSLPGTASASTLTPTPLLPSTTTTPSTLRANEGSSLVPVVQRRYASIAHNHYVVDIDYEREPLPIEGWLRYETSRKFNQRMRTKPGKQARIPGCIQTGQGSVLITVNPNNIQSFLLNDRFLGRRYILTVEGRALEVYPTILHMHPVSFYPMAVSFAPYTGELPRQRLVEPLRGKMRGWEKDYNKDVLLKRRMSEVYAQMRTEVADEGPFTASQDFVSDPEYQAAYGGTIKSTDFDLDEALTESFNNARYGDTKLLELEREEKERDEVMKADDDDDE